MKTPRDLIGRDFADHLIRRFQYRQAHQTGSHIILPTEIPSGQTLPVPAHKPLRPGTLAALVRMVAAHKGLTRDRIMKDL